MPVERGVDCARDLLLIGDVAFLEVGAARLLEVAATVMIAVEEGNYRSLCRESLDDRPTDPLSASCDSGYLPVKSVGESGEPGHVPLGDLSLQRYVDSPLFA